MIHNSSLIRDPSSQHLFALALHLFVDLKLKCGEHNGSTTRAIKALVADDVSRKVSQASLTTVGSADENIGVYSAMTRVLAFLGVIVISIVVYLILRRWLSVLLDFLESTSQGISN